MAGIYEGQMGVAAISMRDERQRWFRRLDLAFWAIWVGFALFIWLAYRANTTAPVVLAASLNPEQAKCAGIVTNPLDMSARGQLLFWSLFTLQLSFYALLIGILHRMVHRFAGGRIFVSETLQGVWLMGIILVIWPFVDVITSNTVAYALHAMGDTKFFVPSYNIDVGTIAGGLFLMALKFVMEHAILLQTENELTI